MRSQAQHLYWTKTRGNFRQASQAPQILSTPSSQVLPQAPPPHGPRQKLGNWDATFKTYLEMLGTLGVPGDIAEFGVYDGGHTIELAKYGRKVWAFDTFEGMPAQEFQPGVDRDEPGKFNPGRTPEEMFEGYPQIIPVQGRFVETLPTIPQDLQICFAFIDCDLYLSHQQVLNWLPSHLTSPAILLFDDDTLLPAAGKAVNEFVKIWPSQTKYANHIITWNKG